MSLSLPGGARVAGCTGWRQVAAVSQPLLPSTQSWRARIIVGSRSVRSFNLFMSKNRAPNKYFFKMNLCSSLKFHGHQSRKEGGPNWRTFHFSKISTRQTKGQKQGVAHKWLAVLGQGQMVTTSALLFLYSKSWIICLMLAVRWWAREWCPTNTGT